MTNQKRHARNTARLEECHPAFARRLYCVLLALEAEGWRPRIQDAWRSPEAQLEAYRTGHSKLKYGYHNATGPNGEKEALAADVLDDDQPLDSRRPYLLALSAKAWAVGLGTGIGWGLPDGLRAALETAIKSERWNAPVKLGWDSTHLQHDVLSVAQVKAGMRPKVS